MSKKAIKEVDIYIGALVRERRIALGMSQQNLGEAIGLTFQQVQKYERGTNHINSSRIVQIANALEVPLAFFFDGSSTSERIGRGDQSSIPYVVDFVASKNGIKLMKAFAKLSKDVQRSVVTLIEKIADGKNS